ncbi:MAG: hypothetical protein Q7S29_05335 [Candidatus Peribacter sp.]|nr:hypothetical protein [Candidatus Peribacter sp.]
MNDDATPATKADIRGLRDEFKAGIGGLRNEFKADICGLHEQITASKDAILHEFHVTVETIRHDLLGANRDEIGQLKDTSGSHERRIRRLERSAGLIA